MDRIFILYNLKFQEQSSEKIECDKNYDVRRTTKDIQVPISNDGCRRDSLNNCQRSSASPTTNIWLRLIEDEENIGNVCSEFLFAAVVIILRPKNQPGIFNQTIHLLTKPN